MKKQKKPASNTTGHTQLVGARPQKDRPARTVGRPKKSAATPRAGPDDDTGGVAAVERALAILDAFEPGEQRLTLAELSRRTTFYKSTILRLAQSLLRHGYLQRLDDGSY